MKVYYNKEENKVPIKSWCPDVEDGALEQAKNLSKLPFVFKHVSLMPDCHQGYGMPIGGVIATKGYIIPNAVGVDIGCGMCAVKSSIKIEDLPLDKLKKIMGEIRKEIPVGFDHRKVACDISEMPEIDSRRGMKIVGDNFESARKQLGTLGGGNHFIEIQKDQDGYVWVMIHSGSRNLGKKVCDYYNSIAKELNKKWLSNTEIDLNFLPVDSKDGKDYLEEMNYCLEFAYANRLKMIKAIIKIFKNEFDKDVAFDEIINIHHNYVAIENHFGENVWVHRKGATRAMKEQIGIIPGSQGTCSYIVEGLGNEESFMSCSHGAGRRMGRNDACRSLNIEEEKKKLDDKGIVHGIRNIRDLDEAPGAYKDIDQVMENQKELVKIITKFEPMGVIKG
jgi:tRNA-splicing ligase RtcB